MNFNKIIANPPFDKNLHLKILREAMKHVEKEGGELVNLSPIRWLQDPLAEYKRGSDWKKFGDIREKIVDIEKISATEATKMFGATFGGDLGIYYINENEGNAFNNVSLYNGDFKLYTKIMSKVGIKRFEENEANHNKEFKITLPAIHGHIYCEKNDDWTELTSKIYEKALQTRAKSSNFYITYSFDTENERRNFYDYLFTKTFKYIVKVVKTSPVLGIYYFGLPFLPTYKKQWTDADLYEYFKLNKDEIKIIEEEMKMKH